MIDKRFKMGVIAIGAYLVSGLFRVAFSSFPIELVCAGIGGVVLFYIGAQSYTDKANAAK